MTKHIIMYSGGIGSWAAAKRVSQKYGNGNLVLLFADTLIEDEDLYRFLEESAATIGGELIKLDQGVDPWQVFQKKRFIGNSRIDPCSRILKREPCRKWLDENCDPSNTVVYLGLDWTEIHRWEKSLKYWHPWQVEAPMMELPYLSKPQMLDSLKRENIKPPRLYELGFPHNNCG